MTTRLEVRRVAVGMCPLRGLASIDDENDLIASAGGARELTDSGVLLPSGASTALFTNVFIHRPKAANAADVVRIVGASGYSAPDYRITHQGPNYTENPLAGADDGTYLLLKDHPFLWDRALNVALKNELFFRHDQTWTPTSDTQRLYTIGTAPLDTIAGITKQTQIHNVQVHGKDDVALELQWRNWYNGRREWDVWEDNDVLLLEFPYPAGPPDTNDRMRLITTRPFSAVTSESTAINVDLQWAAAAVVMVMARWLADDVNEKDEWTQYGVDATTIYTDYRRQLLGKLSHRTYGRSATRTGGVSVGGRGGRGQRGRQSSTLGGRI